MTKHKLRRPLSPSEKAAKKVYVPSKEPKVTDEQVRLVEGKSRKDGRYTHYWHIFLDDQRAGRVYITENLDETGNHFAITVEINQKLQGRGIGTIVFRRAAQQSGVSEVIAEIRRSNMASRIAVNRAGFVEKPDIEGKPLRFVWQSNTNTTIPNETNK